jgi:hypothetical protein
MHAKRCYRFCDSKIVSIYFLDAGRNKRLYVNPLRGRTGRMLHRNNFWSKAIGIGHQCSWSGRRFATRSAFRFAHTADRECDAMHGRSLFPLPKRRQFDWMMKQPALKNSIAAGECQA